MTGCSIDGCDREHYGRGLCNMHWQRWLRSGEAGTADKWPAKRPRPQPLNDTELVRLRRAVGLPDEGPGEAERKRWHQQETQGMGVPRGA